MAGIRDKSKTVNLMEWECSCIPTYPSLLQNGNKLKLKEILSSYIQTVAHFAVKSHKEKRMEFVSTNCLTTTSSSLPMMLSKLSQS